MFGVGWSEIGLLVLLGVPVLLIWLGVRAMRRAARPSGRHASSEPRFGHPPEAESAEAPEKETLVESPRTQPATDSQSTGQSNQVPVEQQATMSLTGFIYCSMCGVGKRGTATIY